MLTKGGDLLNYAGSTLGLHVYYPSALVSWSFQPLLAGTRYSLYSVLLTVPLALGLPVAWFLSYKLWRRERPSRGGALLAALPSLAAMLLIVLVYEWAYLAGFQVIR